MAKKMTKILLCIIVVAASLGCGPRATAAEGVLPPVQPKHLVSESGLCLDFDAPYFKGLDNHDEVAAQLVPCTYQRQNQLWIFPEDNSIRSWGKDLCLVFDRYSGRNFATLNDCYKSSPEAKTWKLWPDGIITHVGSRQVLTATPALPHPLVSLERNIYSPSQFWKRSVINA